MFAHIAMGLEVKAFNIGKFQSGFPEWAGCFWFFFLHFSFTFFKKGAFKFIQRYTHITFKFLIILSHSYCLQKSVLWFAYHGFRVPFWCSFISDLLHVHFPVNTSASKNCLMILPTSFGTLSLKTMPSFSFPVNFCFSAYKHCDFSQLTKSADLSPACLGNFFFCSSLHLNLSLLVL